MSGSLWRDSLYKSAASHSPAELMMLFERVGQRTIYGTRYRLFKGEARGSKYWGVFAKLRKLLVEKNIQPQRYFFALFDHAVWCRRHLKPHNPLASSPQYVRTLWRPWPSTLCSAAYLKIYGDWEARQNGREEEAFHRAKDLAERRGVTASKFQAAIDVKQTWELFNEFPKNYPGYRVAQVLSIVFRDMSPHFLFFCPEAQHLVKRGHGTESQRKVFAMLAAHEAIRERYRNIYELFKRPARTWTGAMRRELGV